MRRGIGRLRAGGGGFSPISVFAGSAAGLWLDPSDTSTGFQDSAGTTPQTASGQPTGKRLDKSGRGNHVTQATLNSRPEYDLISSIATDFFDGLDDGYSTATFAVGTLTSGMDCFIAVKRSSAANGILCSPSATALFGAYVSGGAGAATQVAGSTSTYLVNGVAVPGGTATTQGQLYTAMAAVGSWGVVEVRDLDLSGAAWTAFRVGLYSGFPIAVDIGGLILCPAQSAANRNSIRTWLGNKVGLTL